MDEGIFLEMPVWFSYSHPYRMDIIQEFRLSERLVPVLHEALVHLPRLGHATEC